MHRSGKSAHRTSKGDAQHHTLNHQHKNKQWDSNLPIPALSRQVALVVVFTAAVVCFVNSHDGTFVFDDSEAIINNKDLKPDVPLFSLFKHDFWGSKIDSNASHKSYRPLTVLTFRYMYFQFFHVYPCH